MNKQEKRKARLKKHRAIVKAYRLRINKEVVEHIKERVEQ